MLLKFNAHHNDEVWRIRIAAKIILQNYERRLTTTASRPPHTGSTTLNWIF